MTTLILALGVAALTSAAGSAIFYRLGYSRGYKNARHHRFCGVHMGDYCDCGKSNKDYSIQGLLR